MSDSDLPPHSKICLLICDPTKQDFIRSYGNITNLFTSLYTKLLINFMTPKPDFTPPDVVPDLPMVLKSFRVHPFNSFLGQFPEIDTIDKFDSILVSGSGIDPNSGEEWINTLGEFLHTVAIKHPKVKLIGICFGHQIISRAVFGLKVGLNPKGYEIGPYQVDLTPTGKILFPGHEHLNVPMFHRNAVFSSAQLAFFDGLVEASPYKDKLPQNDYMIWGSTPATDNQGIIAMSRDAARSDHLNVDDVHVFTVQGHPELTQGMTSYLLDLFEDKIDPADVEEGRRRIADFNGILDWFPISLLMWALSTKHSLSLPQLSKKIEEFRSFEDGVKSYPEKEAAVNLVEEEKVFVLIT